MSIQQHDLDDIPPRPYPTYDNLSYAVFLRDHLLPNTPFLLSTNATSHWRSSQQWRLPSTPFASSSKPNLAALRLYETHLVPVSNTLNISYSEFERSEMLLGDVIDFWGKGEGEGLYVKDWHLLEEIEKDGRGVEEVYEVPECFRDDWLNPPYIPTGRGVNVGSGGDFRFVYLGPKGTFTPLHRDVYSSYSWSANVVGRKVWWLFPPDRMQGVRQAGGGLTFDVRCLEVEGGGIKVLQEEGEIIFIPSGWHHQVLNIDFCISINHNFFSSPTLPAIYTALVDSQTRVEESISDVKDMIIQRLGTESGEWEFEWAQEIQGLLERDAGWGWRGFWECIRRNTLVPPGGKGLSPNIGDRDGFVQNVVGIYKGRREWITLPDVKAIVEEVEGMLSHS